LRLRRALSRRLLETRPDVFIGIDAPDFNLGLEIKLRRAGIRTVHYVSPTVWAWREKRVRKIARAADLVLCLFPFEPRFYREHQVAAVYVGHPLADQIDPGLDRSIARSQLGTEPRAPTVAILPGSRRSEVARLAEPMIEAARILSSRRTGLRFVAAMANEGVAELFRAEMQRLGFADIAIVLRDPRRVIAAADVVLCASGTATLEVMLVNRPLVMTYIVAPSTYRIGKALGLVKLDWFSLPNILAGKPLVPELIQDQATGGNLADAAERWLDDPQSVETLTRHFRELGRELRCNAAARAAGEVAAQLESRKK
jgi:lipid-A-disaccharide synthase